MEKTHNILVIDDELTYRLILGDIVSHNFNQKADEAESPFKAFELLNQHQYGLIFLDIQMPEMNGLMALEKIKANPKWSSIPVVAFSALSDKALFDRLTELGAEDIIVKGSSEEVIVDTIRKHLHSDN
jgi:CheY-like chemotaxis protein